MLNKFYTSYNTLAIVIVLFSSFHLPQSDGAVECEQHTWWNFLSVGLLTS